MLQLGDFTAWISVDGTKLTEYNTEISEDGKQATCWIASEVNKNFRVEWNDARKTPSCTTGKIVIDGYACGSRHVHKGGHAGRNDVGTSDTTKRLLLFSELKLTDDEARVDACNPKHIGEISLTIWASTARRRQGRPEPRKYKKNHLQSQTVHEKSKKGGAHCVRLGEEIRSEPRVPSKYSYTCGERIVSFVFKYRPIELLRANGIAPLDASKKRTLDDPAPSERDVKPKVDGSIIVDDDDDPDEAEARSLEAKLRAIREKLAKKDKKPKIETDTSFKFVPGEIIDLT